MTSLIILEGLDRSGKDTLAENLHVRSDIYNIDINNFRSVAKKSYYDVTRTMMRSQYSHFVHDITYSMAIAEFMQILAFIEEFERKKEYTSFVIARSFPSTIVFDKIRGIESRHVEDTIEQLLARFADETGIEVKLDLVKLYVNREQMIDRGSTEESFEIINYARIYEEFNRYDNEDIFKSSLGINTSYLTEEDVYQTVADHLLGYSEF